MSELGDALELMHSACHRYKTMRGTLRFGDEALTRIWFERPARLRVERDDAGHLPALEVTDGERNWQYHDVRGTLITSGRGEMHLDPALFDPSHLLVDNTIAVVGRDEVAGREAVLIRTTPLGIAAALHQNVAAELALDLERGLVLRLSHDTHKPVYEFVEVAFDEKLPRRAFVYRKPRRERKPPPIIDWDAYAPQDVTVEEAGRLAAFAVFELDLPAEWEVSVQYQPQAPQLVSETPAPWEAEHLRITYRLPDATHTLQLLESQHRSPVGGLEWTDREVDGRHVQVSTPHGFARLELQGTEIQLESATLPLELLVQAVGKLRRVPA